MDFDPRTDPDFESECEHMLEQMKPDALNFQKKAFDRFGKIPATIMCFMVSPDVQFSEKGEYNIEINFVHYDDELRDIKNHVELYRVIVPSKMRDMEQATGKYILSTACFVEAWELDKKGEVALIQLETVGKKKLTCSTKITTDAGGNRSLAEPADWEETPQTLGSVYANYIELKDLYWKWREQKQQTKP